MLVFKSQSFSFPLIPVGFKSGTWFVFPQASPAQQGHGSLWAAGQPAERCHWTLNFISLKSPSFSVSGDNHEPRRGRGRDYATGQDLKLSAKSDLMRSQIKAIGVLHPNGFLFLISSWLGASVESVHKYSAGYAILYRTNQSTTGFFQSHHSKSKESCVSCASMLVLCVTIVVTVRGFIVTQV